MNKQDERFYTEQGKRDRALAKEVGLLCFYDDKAGVYQIDLDDIQDDETRQSMKKAFSRLIKEGYTVQIDDMDDGIGLFIVIYRKEDWE